jgi:hypothetical protein
MRSLALFEILVEKTFRDSYRKAQRLERRNDIARSLGVFL